ncbi:MAG: J domain-containing protein [Deltaproteobacteria bacterium]|nr:J domain-containing protein [Deltaproteobacteria bacterium]
MIQLLVCSSLARSESILIHRFPFEVEEISAVDRKNVKLRVLGEEIVISKDEVERQVLRSYFDPERAGTLPAEQTRGFIKMALKAKDYSAAKQAFLSLVFDPGMSEADLAVFLRKLAQDKRSLVYFKKILLSAEALKSKPGILIVLMYYVGLHDAGWVRQHCLRYTYLFGDRLRNFLDDKYYEAVSNGDFTLGDNILRTASVLLGPDDSVVEALHVINARLKRSMSAVTMGNLEGLLPLKDLAAHTPSLQRLLPTLILSAVHRETEKRLLKGESDQAIKILTLIEPEWATSETLRFLKEALDGFKPGEHRPLVETRVYNLIEALAHKESAVKEAYLNFLERLIQNAFRRGSFDNVNFFMSKLLRVRPDPHRSNDSLRLDEALALARRGSTAQAWKKLNEIKTGVSLIAKFRVWAAGIYIGPYLIAFLLALLALLIYVMCNLSKWEIWFRKNSQAARVQTVDSASAHPSEEGTLPLFTNRVRSIDPRRQEYEEFLQKLGLPPKASLKEIKAAYRNAVKAVHPDLKEGGSSSQDSVRFIEFTGIYEHILELRKALGMRE